MMTTTPEHLGSDATELDARAYDVALSYLDDDTGPEWLWNTGDFFDRLQATLQDIVDTVDSENITPGMRVIAQEWLTDRAIA